MGTYLNDFRSLLDEAQVFIEKGEGEEFIRNILDRGQWRPTRITEERLSEALEEASKYPEDVDELLRMLFFFGIAESADHPSDQAPISFANDVLRSLKRPDPPLFDRLWVEYEIPEHIQDKGIYLYRVGTTSLIFRLPKHEYVLKLVKPHYRDNAWIARATREYGTRYSWLEGIAPRVHASSSSYILMDFIPGKTLAEHLEDIRDDRLRTDDGVTDRKAFRHVIRVGQALCSTLDDLHHKHERFHLDLNPYNVIVDPECLENPTVKLIDFGYNYALRERVRPSKQIAYVQEYSAPELADDVDAGNARSDAYSFGVLLIDLLCAHAEITASGISDKYAEVWKRFPEFGRLVDDLIDESGSRLVHKAPNERTFTYVSRSLESSRSIHESIAFPQTTGLAGWIEKIPTIVSPDVTFLVDLWRKWRAIETDNRLAGQAKRLFRWGAVSQVVHTLILMLFAYTIVRNVDFSTIVSSLGEPGSPLKWLQIVSPDQLNSNVWGRLVALSFSFVATHYYLTIFRDVSTRDVDRMAESWLRFNAWCYGVPIAVAIAWDPKLWPFCSAIGVWFVAANNRLMLRVAREANGEILRNTGLPHDSHDHFFDDFENWWRNITGYGLALFGGGLLMRRGLVRDEWLYALLVAGFANLVVMYVNVCSRKGPNVRATLLRLIAGLERARRKA